MQFSRRRLGAFARCVGSDAAAYFDPVIAGYDGYRDVIAPAVFAVVPGQLQQNDLLVSTAPELLPLLHGIHFDLTKPIVAGSHLTAETTITQQRTGAAISAITTRTGINDESGLLLAVITQKLALLEPEIYKNTNATDGIAQPTGNSFTIELTPQDLSDYVTVSGDNNPIHTSTEYAKQFGYQAPLAQGNLMLGRAISQLENLTGNYLLPKQIQARFIAPVEVPAPGAVVIVHYQQNGDRYELTLHHNNHRVARATITT